MTAVTIASGTVSAIAGMGLEVKGIAYGTLGRGNACKLGSDGLVHQSVSSEFLGASGTSAMIDFDGIIDQEYVAGNGVTLYGKGAVIGGFGSGMAVGTALYVSATAGILSDVKVAVADLPVAKVISSTDILVVR